jgi:hypothetical protein
MIERQWALNFAREWIEAWNSHDLERIFSHYTEYESSGTLKGKTSVRPYWSQGLTVEPPLRFELIEVLACVRSITIYYRSIGRRVVAEVLEFNDRREVVRAAAYYALTE